jgi:radical SAM superfamily enzyme YgiQ (UPF0313 family)
MNAWDWTKRMRRRVSEEQGVLRKQASLRVALCHPAPYAAGMSSLGFQTIYREIHLHRDAAADRAFLPDDIESYRKARLPVVTCETETPIADYPVAAFSIAYELEITGILEMLDLSGIPVLRQDRNDRHPLIVAGGPLTYSNPEILAPFADLIILGEGEELIHAFLDAANEATREELLTRFSALPGCCVPGRTRGPLRIARVDDERLPACSQIIAKGSVLSSMFLMEPARGCSRACAYCVMRRRPGGGMRPVPSAKALASIPGIARRVGLVGAAVTDHPEIKELVGRIVAGGREIGISSLRADRLDEELVQLLARGGCRTITTAADGASQRLRDRLNRQTTESHLVRAAELARGARLQKLKLYVMVGVPGETAEDIDELLRFCRELTRIVPLSLSVSSFVAKRNTPLDGAPFEPIPSLAAKLTRIRQGIKGVCEVRAESPRWAWVEYMLSQGGESAGLAAMDAWRAGGRFSSWKIAFARREVPGAEPNTVSGRTRR